MGSRLVNHFIEDKLHFIGYLRTQDQNTTALISSGVSFFHLVSLNNFKALNKRRRKERLR